jgi:hypothetical protein
VPVTGAQANPLFAYSRLDMGTDLKPLDAIWQDVLSIKIKGHSLIGSESGSRKSVGSLRHKKMSSGKYCTCTR